MKIAINTLPLMSAHKGRGIGYYTSNLVDQLKMDQSIQIQEFTEISKLEDADIVHYPWFDLYFHTLPIRKKFPTVVTIHDVMPLVFLEHYPTGIKGKINFILQKTALRNCVAIITDSDISKNDIMKYLKIEDNKIHVVPLAADQQFKVINNDTDLLHVKRKFHLPDRFLLYVGDANWVKNVPFLIEGFQQLVGLPGLSDIKLVLVGGVFLKNVESISHPELQSLRMVNNLIKQYSLDDKIIRPGQIEDSELVGFYNLATVYVQPSIYEGFGLPVLQAFACGAPVASSDGGSLPEVGGDAAIYFDPTDFKRFTSVLKELIEDRSLRNKLSRLGIERAKRFSWEKTTEKTKSIYIALVKH